MNYIIKPKMLFGEINAISSKSYAHRALICAALSNKPSKIYCTDLSEDITATVNCLNGLGAEIKYENKFFIINPIDISKAQDEIDCGESGSTLRFLLPIIGALGLKIKIKMHGRLPERPLSPLYERMCENGCFLKKEGNHLEISGKLKPANYEIAGNISSQFITGLLFALPLLESESKIIITDKFESQSYVNLTIDVLKKYGITFKFSENTFEITPQKYISEKNMNVESDWSNAAFWLCAGALSKNGVKVFGLNFNSVQGDIKIIDILAKFGAKIRIESNFVEVKNNDLNGIEIDASDIPDLVPIICIVACAAKGKTIIKNAQRLRIKESDRIKTVVALIRNLGGNIEETDDGMIIYGSELNGGIVDSCGDHRIAMSATIASMLCKSPVKIENAHAVSKSYPRFYEDFIKLNGEIEEDNN